MNFLIIKTLCSSKIIIKKMKSPIADLEKIFIKRISETGLVSRKYKESLKFNSKKTNIQINNAQNISADTSSKKIFEWPMSILKNA